MPDTPDVAFIHLTYPSGTIAHVELSWLAPSKLRRTAVVGSERMVVYDDTSSEPVRDLRLRRRHRRPGDLRRVPAELPHRRHRLAAGRRDGAAVARAARLLPLDPHGRRAALVRADRRRRHPGRRGGRRVAAQRRHADHDRPGLGGAGRLMGALPRHRVRRLHRLAPDRGAARARRRGRRRRRVHRLLRARAEGAQPLRRARARGVLAGRGRPRRGRAAAAARRGRRRLPPRGAAGRARELGLRLRRLRAQQRPRDAAAVRSRERGGCPRRVRVVVVGLRRRRAVPDARGRPDDCPSRRTGSRS